MVIHSVVEFKFCFSHMLLFTSVDEVTYVVCKQEIVSLNPTQAQCNFSSEALHWVSHETVGKKCQYFTQLAHSDTTAGFCLPQDLMVGPTGASHLALHRY